MHPEQHQTYDVVVAGGGFAGLSLARQLTLRYPGIDIAVIDRTRGSLPSVTHTIGESTVVGGADYLHDVLELRSYLHHHHLQKLGLRFFLGDPRGPFSRRPEFGRSIFRPEVAEWQFDRGKLETELRARVEAAGVSVVRGCSVTEVTLSRDGAPHCVALQDKDGSKEVCGRWFVDATGRRRLLQRQLGLDEPVDSDCSAVWFRVEGHIRPEDLARGQDAGWSGRVPGGYRYLSTNHLMGRGYWVWLIPLPGGFTSIGIVATARQHPFSAMSTHARARSWLAYHEPSLAAVLSGREPLDFRAMRHYIASVPRQVLSADRWACVGEAACRVDPLYSLGTNSIGYANSLVTELIGLDRDGALDPAICTQLDAEFVGWARWVGPAVQSTYRWLGNSTVTGAKLLWDHGYFPGLGTPNLLHRILRPGFVRDRRLRDAASIIDIGRYRQLYGVVVRMLDAWAQRARPAAAQTFAWFDYMEVPFLRRMLLSGHAADTDPFDLWEAHGRVLEDMARGLFLLALRDVASEQMTELPDPATLDPWSLSLDPVGWRTLPAAAERAPDTPPEFVDVIGQLQRYFSYGTA